MVHLQRRLVHIRRADDLRRDAGDRAVGRHIFPHPAAGHHVAGGARGAAALYGVEVPVLVIADADRARLRSGDRVEADRDGRIRITNAVA